MKTIFFDLDLFYLKATPDSVQDAKAAPISIERIMASFPWYQYEQSKISRTQCLEKISEEYRVGIEHVARFARDRFHPHHFNQCLSSEIMQMRLDSELSVRIIGTFNIPEEEYEMLRSEWPHEFWSLFDTVFTSASMKMRKPSLGFYRHVLEESNINLTDAIFIEENAENTLVARSLGVRGFTAEDGSDALRILKNSIGDPVKRGQAFLHDNAHSLSSISNDDIKVEDSYSQILIFENTGDRNLVVIKGPKPNGKWNFFTNKPIFTTKTYPDDMDTTSLAFLNLDQDENLINSVMDEMLNYCDEDGIVMTHFDKSRPRVDPVIAVNILTLFHSRQRVHELATTYNWIREILIHRAYLDGTLYYSTAEWFLFYINRLISYSSDTGLKADFGVLLKERIQERVGASGDALCLAMRLVVCASMGVPNSRDLETLLSMQEIDGGWERSNMYCFPRLKKSLGNRGVTTAIAIRAIAASAKTIVS